VNTCAAVLKCKCVLKRVGVGASVPFTLYYCVSHGYQPLEAVHPKEWRVRCQTCTFGRWCGQSKSAARRKARDHVRGFKRDHYVFVAYDKITRDGKGIVLASGYRWPPEYFAYSTSGQLPLYEVDATIKTAVAGKDDPPPF
jgi:hypothetical protein